MVGKSYFLNIDFKSLGRSVFFAFIRSGSHSAPLLLICTLVFSYRTRSYISHPEGDTCSTIQRQPVSVFLYIHEEWRRGTERTLIRFVDDTEIDIYLVC